jgi:hypothetical protein
VFGIQRIAFAFETTALAARTIDLHYHVSVGAEVAGKPGTVAPGAFNRESPYFPQRLGPVN